MRSRKPDTDAFTLTELMVVVVLTGMIAAFAIPNYTKSVNRVREKNAVANLGVIREAARLYISREGGTPPPALANTAAINATLFLNIIEQEGNTYQCVIANIYTCRATNTHGWQAQFQLDTNDGAVSCSIATCPSL